MRKKIIAANWKMNLTVGEAEAFLHTFLHEVGGDNSVEVVIVPPFTALSKVSEILGRGQAAKLGAQNMHWEKSGAFTGEISAPMLRELYVRYVVLGHSERRTIFGETDQVVNRKVRAALDAALKPIVCVGEALEQRDDGQVETVLHRRLEVGSSGLSGEEISDAVIRLRTRVGDWNRPYCHPGAGSGGARIHSEDDCRALGCGYGGESSDSIWWERKASELS
jgi:triosephosphate isomerase